MRPFYQTKAKRIRMVRSARFYSCIDEKCSPVSDCDMERLKKEADEAERELQRALVTVNQSTMVITKSVEINSIMLLPNDPRPSVLTFLIKRLSIVDLENAVKRIIFNGFRQYLSYPEIHVYDNEVIRFISELEKPLWIEEEIVKPNISI